MHQNLIRVLLVEDNPTDALLVKDELLHVMMGQFMVEHVEYLNDALKRVQQKKFDVILLDLNLPDSNGVETFDRLHSVAKDIPIALLSYRADEPLAIRMIKAGAQDYLVKGRMIDGVLPRVIRYSIERKRTEDAARIATQRFQTIFEKAPLGIALINSMTEKFVHVNQKYIEISGYSWEEFKKINRIQIMHPDDQEMYLDKIELMKTGQIRDFNLSGRIVRPDQSIGWIDMAVVSIDYKDHHLYHLCMIEDVTEKRKTMMKLASLTQHLQKIRETERTKISREIHDVLGGVLSIIRMDLDWLSKKIESESIEFKSLGKKIYDLHQLTGESIEIIRKISKNLRPGTLDNLGLKAAIEGLVQDFQQRHDIKCHLEIANKALQKVRKKYEIEIFRIFQEAFNNIAQHAQATIVEVNIANIENVISIEIRDNGIGITEQQLLDPNSFGIHGMSERANQINGHLEIKNNSPHGCILHLSIPIKNNTRRNING